MSRKLHASLALLALLVQGQVLAKTYTVKKGDSLSLIAGREIGKPILGPTGSLQKVLRYNPKIQNPNLIYPQQVIRLSEDVAQQAPAAPVSNTAPAPKAEPAQAASQPAAVATEAAVSPARFGLKLGVGVDKDELEAVDHERSFATTRDSEAQLAMDLDAYYKPSEASRVGLSLGIKAGDYEDSADGRFEGASGSLTRFSAFGEMTLAQRWHLGLELGTEQSFFFQQTGIADFGMEAVFVDFATVTASFDIIARDSWRWSLGAHASVHGPSDAEGEDVEQGSSYAVATQLAYRLSASYTLEGSLQYGRRQQGIEGIRQKTTERAADISLRYEF